MPNNVAFLLVTYFTLIFITNASQTFFLFYIVYSFQAYFCGHDEFCMDPHSTKAYSQAVEHMEHHYPVVAILEDLQTSFTVLENALPLFFANISDVFMKTSEIQLSQTANTVGHGTVVYTIFINTGFLASLQEDPIGTGYYST